MLLFLIFEGSALLLKSVSTKIKPPHGNHKSSISQGENKRLDDKFMDQGINLKSRLISLGTKNTNQSKVCECMTSSFMLEYLTLTSNANFRNCIHIVRELLSYIFLV